MLWQEKMSSFPNVSSVCVVRGRTVQKWQFLPMCIILCLNVFTF